MGDFLIEFATRAVALVAATWLVMLTLGAAHSHDGHVPAPGFLTVGWVLVAVSTIAGFVKIYLKD